jgi:hypothetical protein
MLTEIKTVVLRDDPFKFEFCFCAYFGHTIDKILDLCFLPPIIAKGRKERRTFSDKQADSKITIYIIFRNKLFK